ncbi:hypothetical protein BDV59DRAFT_199593 [Aspergillus ambiguus]|uniref:uncharacterized protein n=1 Tax=Aspergillus ambiguus TaxID=176160 RepID=UPI003CCCAAC6
MAVKITNVMCGSGGSFRCKAFFSIVHAKIGGTIGSGIQAMCTPSYKALWASFQVEEYANSAEN